MLILGIYLKGGEARSSFQKNSSDFVFTLVYILILASRRLNLSATFGKGRIHNRIMDDGINAINP